MRAPRGLTVTLDGVKDGQAYFNVTATKFYLFKTILRVGCQNFHHPHIACLIFLFALYYLMK